MKKIFKILSILVMVFVLFSCANSSSNPEEPTVTEPQTYSITFIAEKCPKWDQPVADLLNSLPDYKNLEEGTEVELPTVIHALSDEEYVLEEPEPELHLSYHTYNIYYEDGEITSIKVGNEDIEIKF